jgi:hypothetical protein
MFFAYTDDSRAKHNGVLWQIMATVLVRDSQFRTLEAMLSVVSDNLIPLEKRAQFTEFKASEMYGGHGLYQGIPKNVRHGAIATLLSFLRDTDIMVVYGALNLNELKKLNLASANPFDVVFRICARGVENWMDKQLEWQYQYYIAQDTPNQHIPHPHQDVPYHHVRLDDKALFIVDESGENKALLQQTYRQMRRSYRQADDKSELQHVFDDMYFGDSKFSVGIQMADACAYFIGKHVSADMEAEEIYALIEPHIVYFEIEPKK